MAIVKDRDRFVKYDSPLEAHPVQFRNALREVERTLDSLIALLATSQNDPLLVAADRAEFSTEVDDLIAELKASAAKY